MLLNSPQLRDTSHCEFLLSDINLASFQDPARSCWSSDVMTQRLRPQVHNSRRFLYQRLTEDDNDNKDGLKMALMKLLLKLTEACDDGSAGIRKQWRQWNNFYDNFLSVPVTGRSQESECRDAVQWAGDQIALTGIPGKYHDNTEIITQIIRHNCTITLHL